MAANPEAPVNQDQHIVLSYMAHRHARIGDSVKIDKIMDYGISKGLTLEELGCALIEASVNGWILAFDHYANLTRLGHQFISPATTIPKRACSLAK